MSLSAWAYPFTAGPAMFLGAIYASAWGRRGLTPKQIYEDAYKDATGNGARHKEAHEAGIEAVYQHALDVAARYPLRRVAYRQAARLSKWLEKKARP